MLILRSGLCAWLASARPQDSPESRGPTFEHLTGRASLALESWCFPDSTTEAPVDRVSPCCPDSGCQTRCPKSPSGLKSPQKDEQLRVRGVHHSDHQGLGAVDGRLASVAQSFSMPHPRHREANTTQTGNPSGANKWSFLPSPVSLGQAAGP